MLSIWLILSQPLIAILFYSSEHMMLLCNFYIAVSRQHGGGQATKYFRWFKIWSSLLRFFFFTCKVSCKNTKIKTNCFCDSNIKIFVKHLLSINSYARFDNIVMIKKQKQNNTVPCLHETQEWKHFDLFTGPVEWNATWCVSQVDTELTSITLII